MTDTQFMILEFGSKGYTCSQILVKAALRMMYTENDSLVRSMNGLSQGVANTGQTCGALTGGLCLLSLYTAKGNDSEFPDENEALMWDELVTWFSEEICNGKLKTCDQLLGLDKTDSKVNRLSGNTHICAEIVGKVWEKCLEILANYEIDPTEERNS